MVNTKPITGYKVFCSGWESLNHIKQYECPGDFYEYGKLEPGLHGMHFCTDITDLWYYSCLNTNAFECNYYVFANVVAPDGSETTGENKLYVTNHLYIINEIPLDVVIKLVNPEYFRNMDKFTRYPIYVKGLDNYFNNIYNYLIKKQKYFIEKQKLELEFYD